MDKIRIIFVREYLSRVKTKMFLLSTLLTPLGFILIMGLSIALSSWREDEATDIYLEDIGGKWEQQLKGQRGNLNFITDAPADVDAWLTEEKGRVHMLIDSTLHVSSPPLAEIRSAGNIPLSVKETIQDTLTQVIRQYRLAETGISSEALKRVNEEVKLKTLKVTEEGTERSSTGLAAILGYVMGFLIYIFMFTYGMIVMRGVMEEKTNRIVEIIISSVRPFQLMIGKLLSIACVGLTQFTIWIILIFALSTALTPMLGLKPADLQKAQGMSQGIDMPAEAKGENNNMMAEEIMAGMQNFDPMLIVYFLFYFLGGYLLYGSLFAAVGSAVDQETDAQQLMWPITIPLIIPMLMLGNIIQQPDGTLAVFASIFPLFSPVCMMVRLASVSVPWYELLASMLSLVLTFLAVIWLAGRIYRVGIFMYGKKPSIKEITRWIFS